MARRKKLVNKEAKKRGAGKCKFCPCDEYALLDLHRIIAGDEYSEYNTVVCCANCHRKIHAGIIKLDRQYSSMSGKIILHYWMDGKEYWD